MLLEKFHDYPNLIYVNVESSSHQYSFIDEEGGEEIVGIGDVVAGKLLYFYVKSAKLFFVAGDIEIDLSSEGILLGFKQESEGDSIFYLRKGGEEIFSLRYAPWWATNQTASPVGLGAPSDEDKDFLAYLTLMSQSKSRLQHLIDKYS